VLDSDEPTSTAFLVDSLETDFDGALRVVSAVRITAECREQRTGDKGRRVWMGSALNLGLDFHRFYLSQLIWLICGSD
jgi:hypothetical protein